MEWSLLGFRALDQMMNVHPALVHFPIAFFPAAFLFYFLGIVFKKDRFLSVGHALLLLALLFSLFAVITGQLAEDSIPHNEEIHRLMMVHQKVGFAVLILGAVLSVWSFFRKNSRPMASWLFLILLFLASLMVFQSGDLGGRMVFVEGAAVKPMAPMMEEGHHHHEGDEHEHHH